MSRRSPTSRRKQSSTSLLIYKPYLRNDMIKEFDKTYFTTFTLNNWNSTFEDFPESVESLYSSFQYLVDKKDVKVYAFVIMRDHIHLIWKVTLDRDIKDIIISFKKHTGRALAALLKKKDLAYLEENFMSERKDRMYKIWKVNCGNLKLTNHAIIMQ